MLTLEQLIEKQWGLFEREKRNVWWWLSEYKVNGDTSSLKNAAFAFGKLQGTMNAIEVYKTFLPPQKYIDFCKTPAMFADEFGLLGVSNL